MRTPEIQMALVATADDSRMPPDLADRVKTLARALSRRKPIGRAERKSTPMTTALAQAIRHYRAAFPDASQTEIARVFEVNPGRVSEAIRGKRT